MFHENTWIIKAICRAHSKKTYLLLVALSCVTTIHSNPHAHKER